MIIDKEVKELRGQSIRCIIIVDIEVPKNNSSSSSHSCSRAQGTEVINK